MTLQKLPDCFYFKRATNYFAIIHQKLAKPLMLIFEQKARAKIKTFYIFPAQQQSNNNCATALPMQKRIRFNGKITVSELTCAKCVPYRIYNLEQLPSRQSEHLIINYQLLFFTPFTELKIITPQASRN